MCWELSSNTNNCSPCSAAAAASVSSTIIRVSAPRRDSCNYKALPNEWASKDIELKLRTHLRGGIADVATPEMMMPRHSRINRTEWRRCDADFKVRVNMFSHNTHPHCVEEDLTPTYQIITPKPHSIYKQPSTAHEHRIYIYVHENNTQGAEKGASINSTKEDSLTCVLLCATQAQEWQVVHQLIDKQEVYTAVSRTTIRDLSVDPDGCQAVLSCIGSVEHQAKKTTAAESRCTDAVANVITICR